MRVVEHQFSELLRHPKDVTRDVVNGDVLLRRRNEPDLRLTSADRDAQQSELFEALARTFRNLADHHLDALDDALGDAFAWLEFLPSSDRKLFVDEFVRIVRAAGELDNYAPLGQLVREWRDSAAVYADPELAGRLRGPLDAVGEAVPVPAA
jgi:hypothetical protein